MRRRTHIVRIPARNIHSVAGSGTAEFASANHGLSSNASSPKHTGQLTTIRKLPYKASLRHFPIHARSSHAIIPSTMAATVNATKKVRRLKLNRRQNQGNPHSNAKMIEINQ